MIGQLQRTWSWSGRVIVVAIALLGWQLHGSGTPERALAEGGAAVVIGSVVGIAMVAIVVARLVGRDIPLIGGDRGVIVALLFLIAVKFAIARLLLPA